MVTPSADTSPETYLGSARADRFVPAPPSDGVHRFSIPAGAMELSTFALGGTWRITPESAEAVAGARLAAQIQARNVYLVLSSRGGVPRRVRVRFDGRAYPTVVVRRQQLYTLVSLPRVAAGRLELSLDPGVSGYAFTFG